MATADLYTGALDGGKTRSSRIPHSIEYYVNPQLTRTASDADTLLYIVNYGDNEGFAILGADRRCLPVYGFSNEGSLNLSDTTVNCGLASCMSDIRASLSHGLPSLGDSTAINPWKPPYPGFPYDPVDPGYGDRELTILEKTDPKIAPQPSIWAQRTLFNSQCPMTPSGQALVGCVPLACAQVMSYFRWPTVFEGQTLDWEIFINTKIKPYLYANPDYDQYYNCPEGLAQFLANIGKALNVNYGTNATTVNANILGTYFSKFGYNTLGAAKDFATTSVSSSLVNNPIIVFADNVSGNVGHCWVIDGYVCYKEVWNAIDNENHTLYHAFYHCVWGHGARNNGWFVYNDGTMGGLPCNNEYVKPDDSVNVGNPGYYKNIKYFTGFNPLR